MTQKKSNVQEVPRDAPGEFAAGTAFTPGSISVVLESSFDGVKWKRTSDPDARAAMRRAAVAALKRERRQRHGR